MSKTALRALAGAALVLGATALLGAGPAGAGTLGSLTITPATGADTTPLSVRTSAGCPADAPNITVAITGAGFPAAGQNVVGNTDAGVSSSGPFSIALSDTLAAFEAQQPTPQPLSGVYDLTLTCRTALDPASKGTYTGQLLFTSPTAYTTDVPAASPSPSPSAPPATGFAFTRLAGNGRYETAARIATESFSTASTVILANGQSDDPRTTRNENHFPDALAAAYLAGNRGAPTLLTAETSLPAPTSAALTSLGARSVIIVGGTSAVSSAVESQLRSAGYTTSRVSGAGRYDTAKAVATTPPAGYVGTSPEGDRTAIVASGLGFPDALVAGPLAYRAKFPILITDPASLSSQTRSALTGLGIKRVLVAGGTAAVSAGAEQQLRSLGITVQRLAGTNRSATAVAVATYAYDRLAFDAGHVNLATGTQFPDALAGGPHGGAESAPILLTASSTEPGTATLDFLRARSATLRTGHVFGGTAAVSQSAQDSAATAASGR